MDAQILFTEKQRFTQWWLWVLLAGVNGLLVFAVFYQVVAGRPFGSKPIGNAGLLFTAGSVLLLTALFRSFRLDTAITLAGIQVRFRPFHTTALFYPWSGLSQCYLRAYSPLKEYGGWGLRYSPFGGGTAFNVSGNQGLQLVTTDGKKILIGTRRPAAIAAVLERSELYRKES